MTAICALPPLSSSTRTDMLGLQAADCLASGSLQCETKLHGAEHTDIGESNLPVAEPQMRSLPTFGALGEPLRHGAQRPTARIPPRVC
jgi:hypothetical protein